MKKNLTYFTSSWVSGEASFCKVKRFATMGDPHVKSGVQHTILKTLKLISDQKLKIGCIAGFMNPQQKGASISMPAVIEILQGRKIKL